MPKPKGSPHGATSATDQLSWGRALREGGLLSDNVAAGCLPTLWLLFTCAASSPLHAYTHTNTHTVSGQPGLGHPALFSACRAQSLRALTQQWQSAGEKGEEQQERGGSHRRCEERSPPGSSAALVKDWWIGGKLWARNDKEISCHMGCLEITGIRCSNFAFLS